jgi:RimJ/RimL family protein N-acetyltransferase
VSRYQGWEPQSDQEASHFISAMSGVSLFPRGEWMQLGIADRGTNALIGDLGICITADGEKAEIGFTIAPAAQGQGLGSEAVGAAIGLVFEHTLVAQIFAVTDARNLPSVRLLERVGMRRIETVAAFFRGEACTEIIYAISNNAAP